MQLAGIRIRDTRVIELLRRSHREAAIVSRPDTMNLDIIDREFILSVFQDPPLGLEIPRAVLLNQHVWRKAEGL